ncbi:MAG: hypothetical protein IIZ33_03205 [Erysipelotrichaceae bacterium]|nr:hypothetical protein [Erysipelotrichaceae bacterium]
MKVFKEKKQTILTSCFLSLLPMFIGLLKWNDLPERIPFYFGRGMNPIARPMKSVVVIVIPLILLVIVFLCILLSKLDKEWDDLMFHFRMAISPLVSIIISVCIYSYDELGYFKGKVLLFLLGGLVLLFLSLKLKGADEKAEETIAKVRPILSILGCLVIFLGFVF